MHNINNKDNVKLKGKSTWKYKGIINTFYQQSGKFTKEYVKGKITFRDLWYPFYLVEVKPKDDVPMYRNIFMKNYDQIVGSFSPNDNTIFYLNPNGEFRAKFYSLIPGSGNKTRFGNIKLFN